MKNHSNGPSQAKLAQGERKKESKIQLRTMLFMHKDCTTLPQSTGKMKIT